MNDRSWKNSTRNRGRGILTNRKKALLGTLRSLLKDYRAPTALLSVVATDLYESLNTPISLKCEILLRYGELEQLARLSVDPMVYVCPFRFADDYQAVSFLKKAPLKIKGVDPEEAAREKFLEAEAVCRLTNHRIRSLIRSPEKVRAPVLRAITAAAGKINQILGPSIDSREWLYACRFGPGVFNHPRSKGLTSLYDKLQVQPSVSHDMVDVAALLVMSQPHWARSITDSEEPGFWPILRADDFVRVPGNKVAFVPKTAVTDRAIAIEPLINIYAQLGIGAVMRRKLKRVGIDLDDQSANQRAALKGSLDGSLATIDLSSASDTVAKELVRLLLPEGWFGPLDIVRSKFGYYNDEWIRYEKFSSMGNGSTFELESMIFYGLMLGVCTELDISTDEVLVYGDDIVIPVAAYGLATEVLEYCGFSLNKSKSFAQGPFRESCGKDYFNGHDVRPFFQKEIPHEIDDLFRLANGIRMLAHRRNNRFGCDSRMRKPWDTVLRAIPRPVAQHCRVPGHAGDSDGIKSNWDESQLSFFVVPNKNGWEGFDGLRYQSVPVTGSPPSNWLGVVASQLYRLGDGGRFTNKLMGEWREPDTRELITLNKGKPLLGCSDLKVKGSVSASPRQSRGSSYRLRAEAFYGLWTDLGPWS